MNNGKNTKNIKSRRDKGEGNVRQIMTILDDMRFGPYQFEVAIILRESLFINSILSNSEPDQESLLSCEKLADSSRLVANLPQYSDLFCEDVGKQFVILSILEEKFKMRNKAIDKIKKTNEKS